MTPGRAPALAAPAALLLLGQVGLYAWLAPSGFEFTDEAYYLLNLLHWREFQGNVSFFGAYFELPFLALGQDIAAVRLFSLVLLLACSAHATLAVLRYAASSASLPTWAFAAAGMAGSMLYFSILSTLRVPSYNLGALCAALLATALLLGLLSAPEGQRARTWPMLAYGLALGACGLNKASAGLALVLTHALFLLWAGRPWLAANGVRFAVLCGGGGLLNVAALTMAAPHWFDQLREGVALVSSTDGRGLLALANLARWQLQTAVLQNLHWAALAALVYLVGVWAERSGRARLAGVPEVMLVLAASAALASPSASDLWWPVVSWATLLLTFGVAWRRAGPLTQALRDRCLALVLLLLALPLALSFGTNMPVLEHSKTNAVFAVLALVAALASAAGDGVLTRPAVAASLALLCLPGLAFQWRAATQADQAYRQRHPLAEQNVPVTVGSAGAHLMVDPDTAKGLQDVRQALLAAGWKDGSPMLDLTGDGPGWVYAMGGRPVGVAWLLGGYAGSSKTVEKVVHGQPPDRLLGAWLLVSDTNPRRIADWSGLLRQRLGDSSHEKVGTLSVAAPYRWSSGGPDRFDLQLWRPRAP